MEQKKGSESKEEKAFADIQKIFCNASEKHKKKPISRRYKRMIDRPWQRGESVDTYEVKREEGD